jgi:hypothetical protein
MAKADTDGNIDAALLSVPADGAMEALDEAGDQALALIAAWIKQSNAAAVQEVAERGSGKSRKAARRGLNVLKSRGVELPERHHVASLGGGRGEETFEAYMLAPDTAGNVLLVVTARAPASRIRSVFVFLNDEQGVHRVDQGELSQSQLRDSLARVLPGAEYKPVKVPVEWTRARIAAARRRHAETGQPEPLGLDSAASLLDPAPDEVPPHPFDEEGLELSEDDARAVAEGSRELHSLPEFRGWFPTREGMDELLAKLGEDLEPGQSPDPETMTKKLEEELSAATDRYFSPERRGALVRAMRDSALSVLSREGETRALEVVATMKMIEKAGLITDPPRDIPFLRGFFEKAVSLMLAQGGGKLRVPVPGKPVAEPGSDDAPAG